MVASSEQGGIKRGKERNQEDRRKERGRGRCRFFLYGTRDRQKRWGGKKRREEKREIPISRKKERSIDGKKREKKGAEPASF